MANGKGSDPRPLSVSREEYAENWERVFRGRRRPAMPGDPFRTLWPEVADAVDCLVSTAGSDKRKP